MKEKLLLVDGSSMLVTAFHGSVPFTYRKTGDTDGIMQTRDGRFTNAVLTMSRTLLNIMHYQKPTHLVVCWDLKRQDLKRTKFYPEYKANRKPTKSELSEQFGTMKEVLDHMGIAQLELFGEEADDIIGTLANKFEGDIPTYIITKDQDALQLINDNTKVWLVSGKSKDLYDKRGINIQDLNLPNNVFEFDKVTFKEEYGIEPIQMIDKKALEGDTADNIPGVKGVGQKTADALLSEYDSIEVIYDLIERTPKKELDSYFKSELGISRSPVNNLIKYKDDAFMSKKLATIDINLSEYNELKLEDLLADVDAGKTKDIFRELEFTNLLSHWRIN